MVPLTRRLPLALVVLQLALLSQTADAAPLCRWVDENGRTQISDVVPGKYAKVAVCTDSRKYELSAQEQRDAERRAFADRAKPVGDATNAPKQAASSPRPPVVAASQPRPKRPSEAVTSTTDCNTSWRIYEESVECFGPFRNALGGIKPEAFDVCNEVASPAPRCGPRTK